MTPEEINSKALELAVRHFISHWNNKKINDEAICIANLAIKYREFIADTSWAEEDRP